MTNVVCHNRPVSRLGLVTRAALLQWASTLNDDTRAILRGRARSAHSVVGWCRVLYGGDFSGNRVVGGANVNMSTEGVGSWKALADLADRLADEPWIFRGESSAERELRPMAGRVGAHRGAARKLPYAKQDEIEALEQFKREVRPHLGHRPENELEWLAVAQHHGMATRLLDWTESILVAAWFAVVEAGTLGAAVIYGIRTLPEVTDDEAEAPFSLSEARCYHPPHIASRITAQRSVFTVHPDPTEQFAPIGLERWLIKQGACARIKHVLSTCGINESSLFPGIDGLSRHIRWRYKWAKFDRE